MNNDRLWQSVAVMGLLAILAGACSTAPPPQSPFMENMGVDDLTTRELQLMVYAFAAHFEGRVELAAKEIQQNADSREIKHNAILWKVNGIPHIHRAAFTPDPLGGLSNMWALAAQMRGFFETGEGTDVFGEWQAIAVDATRMIESDAQQMAALVIGESRLPTFQHNIETWAEDNPFKNMLMVRTGDSSAFLRSLAGDHVGGLAAAASLNVEVQTINDRMALLSTYIPRQVQWQTELLMAQTPELIAGQRDSILAAVGESAAAAVEPFLKFWVQEREALMVYVTEERSAVLEGIANERLAALQALAEERSVVLERIAQERNLTLEQINTLTLAAIEGMLDESGDLSTSTIDHVFLRSVQLMAIPAIVLLVICIAFLLWIRNSINRYLRLLESGAHVTRNSDREA